MCPFTPSRGLRQGDPLSPYLFLLVADCLSVLIEKQETVGRLQGTTVSRRGPRITHLLFADDSMLFFRANEEQTLVVKQVLQTFERGTGQLLSPAKCSLLVNEDHSEDMVTRVCHVVCLQRLDFKAKYLRLSTPHGRMRRGQLQPLEECFVKRMVAWKEHDLSSTAKEILIKSIARALPTYVMSIFKLPLTMCDDLMKQIRALWWGADRGRRKEQWTP